MGIIINYCLFNKLFSGKNSKKGNSVNDDVTRKSIVNVNKRTICNVPNLTTTGPFNDVSTRLKRLFQFILTLKYSNFYYDLLIPLTAPVIPPCKEK